MTKLKYYCVKCKRNHFVDSKIGILHIQTKVKQKQTFTPRQIKERRIILNMKFDSGEYSKDSIKKIGKLSGDYETTRIISSLKKQGLIYKFTGTWGTPVYMITEKGRKYK